MAQITVMDHVEYADKTTSEVHGIITADGCELRSAYGIVVNITWEQMVDVEYLSTLFADTTVRVFKVIVQLLGKVYAGRDAYMLLM